MFRASSAKCGSVAVLVFGLLAMVGMGVSAGSFSGMFGPNLECYVASNTFNLTSTPRKNTSLTAISGRRELLDLMLQMKHQHEEALQDSMSGILNHRQRQLVANDDSCNFAEDDVCDDGGTSSSFHVCTCGSDTTDCAARTAEDCSDAEVDKTWDANAATADKLVAEVSSTLLPILLVPPSLACLFLFPAALIALCTRSSCCAIHLHTAGSILALLAGSVYSFVCYMTLVYGTFFVAAVTATYGECMDDEGHCPCVEETQGLVVTIGLGSLLGAFGLFGSSVCANIACCGIRRARRKPVGPR